MYTCHLIKRGAVWLRHRRPSDNSRSCKNSELANINICHITGKRIQILSILGHTVFRENPNASDGICLPVCSYNVYLLLLLSRYKVVKL